MTVDPALVCFPFVGDAIGGSHISAAGLIKQLDHRRFRPLVLLQRDDGGLARFLRSEGIAVEAAPSSLDLDLGKPASARQIIGLAIRALSLARFLRSRNVAVVHTNDGRSHLTWGLAARLAGAKLVWHHRGDPGAAGLRFAAPWLANRVVAVSKFAAPRPGLLSAAAKCEVVHSPFDTDLAEDRNACRERLIAEIGCPAETRLIGFFGALITRKRPLLFVEAIAALRRRAPDLPVLGLIFGEAFEGLDAAVLSHARALGVAGQIRLMGFRYPGSPWLAACDLLMVPAVDEPFGRTLIEAMLLGTPIVATRSGGNPEAIVDGRTGIIVPPEDPDALADGALRVLTDPELARSLVSAARLDARQRFGDDRHAATIMKIYATLLASASLPHMPVIGDVQRS